MRSLIVGAGVTGRAAARLLQRLGESVVVYDADPSALSELAAEGFATIGGAWSPELLDRMDRLIVSPGVPPRAGPIRDAEVAGVLVVSEVDVAAAVASAPLVAVTGTNGKSTVTRLIAEMLDGSGIKAVAAGNIGTALADVVLDSWEVLVVELSSFQLRFSSSIHPRVAVLLNIAPDHLDWHGSMSDYAAAKARIFARQTEADSIIYDADDPGAAAAVAAATSARVPVSGRSLPAGGAGPSDGSLVFPGGTAALEGLTDPAFIVDAAAAAAAAALMGANPDGVQRAIANFNPGPHRRELVANVGGVQWVDDSKATNPHAAVASVRAYESVVLIAGGLAKGLDLDELVNEPNVKSVVAIGEAADAIVAARPDAERAGSMEAAVAAAFGRAGAGDTVLLAPGCASFDMFRSYAARGEAFAAAVAGLGGGGQ